MKAADCGGGRKQVVVLWSLVGSKTLLKALAVFAATADGQAMPSWSGLPLLLTYAGQGDVDQVPGSQARTGPILVYMICLLAFFAMYGRCEVRSKPALAWPFSLGGIN